jgi:hypothetical protein
MGYWKSYLSGFKFSRSLDSELYGDNANRYLWFFMNHVVDSNLSNLEEIDGFLDGSRLAVLVPGSKLVRKAVDETFEFYSKKELMRGRKENC